jgi:cobalt-zinc-cadmium efflux system membrane fusion protein
MFLHRVAVIGGLAISLLLAVPQAYAHEGHVHAEEPPPVSMKTGVRAESASAIFELVAIAKGTALEFYLDDFTTNRPISGASIDVETPEGPATAVAQPDQLYRLEAPFLGKPGRYDLVVTVTAGSLIDVLPLSIEIPPIGAAAIAEHPTLYHRLESVLNVRVLSALAVGTAFGMLIMAVTRRRRAAALLVLLLPMFGPGTLQAHEGHIHEEASTKPAGALGELAQRLADDTIFVPKPVQRILAIGTLLIEPGTYHRSIELPGRIIPDPNASGLVQPSASGRLSPPPGGFPRLGSTVKQGDVLAYLTHHMEMIDVSDMRQRQGELDQQISIVERKLARYERLASSGAVAHSQLEETRLELQGLRDRRAALDKVRQQSEALVAPVSGVIAEGTPVAGQVAHSNTVVFHIVDPTRLWVEALSFDPVSAGATASAQIATGRSLTLSYRGAGLAGRSQSIPVHFAIEGDTGGLRAGQFVTVLLTTDEKKQGIALPRTALVRNVNGQDFVFEHVSAERFARRAVRFEPLDGERVLVLAGVERGTRIVARGAELIGHVR